MEGTKIEGDDTMLDELINYKQRNLYDNKKKKKHNTKANLRGAPYENHICEA